MYMKNIFYSLVFMLIIFSGTSCKDASFLDETVTSDLDLPRIFSDSAYTVGYLSEIYVELGFDVSPRRFFDRDGLLPQTYGGLQGGCDEVELKVKPKITTDLLFTMGTVNPVNITDDAWKLCYENIRRVNIFFEGINHAPLQEGLKRTYKAEARFLRAWYYATLLKHYGGIPLIGDTIYTVYDDIHMQRNTYAECVDYIVKECKTAEEYLPSVTSGRDFGRISKGACRALVARVLLYAASPLFNGSSFGTDTKTEAGESYPKELVGYEDYDKNRWKEAADAAAEVIRMNAYKLYVNEDSEYGGVGAGFAKLFFGETPESHCGHILDWRRPRGRERENLFQPPSFGANGMGGFPYQELVDAFPMKDGSVFNWNNPDHANNPYSNRDPRFYHSIYFDQVILIDRENPRPVDIHLNADGSESSQDAVHKGTPTGYYSGKQLKQTLAGNYIHGGEQSIPVIRYAEILLNYAEAQNEYGGPASGFNYYDAGGNAIVFSPYTALKLIRERAGIDAGDGNYGLNPNMDENEMREAIRQERRIELAIEGHRFWDVRRWMIAETTDNKQMTGMEVQWLDVAGTSKVYRRFDVRKHIFRTDKSMYLWPIPYKEITKSEDMIQNPYYN